MPRSKRTFPLGESAQRWSVILAQMRSSGLSLRDFAEANDLNPRTLSWWRWSLERAQTTETSTFLEVEARPATGGISLSHPRLGICVEVGPDTDLQLLRALLEALC
jgi:hypothetical protein